MNSSNLSILEKYLQKRSLFSSFINSTPNPDVGIVIVIPCYDEPDIIKTLESIENCHLPKKKIEILIVINSSETTSNKVVEHNRFTEKIITEWATQNGNKAHNYYTILLENITKKNAGAGFARKTGMDEAIYRFFNAKVENGIICSLDADSTVAPNYLIEVENLFSSNINCNGCSIYFEHAIDGNEFSDQIYRRITEYELHIRYYKHALRFINFPHYHYTVGSSFAVSAKAYSMQGGMNKKQAGEDFYFLQKIMPMGNYFEVNTTTVYPSSRPSDRVPFGTGPIINQYLNLPEKDFVTYNFEAFIPLKQFFSDINLFFNADNHEIEKVIENYHPSLHNFLNKINYKTDIEIMNSNTAQLKNFEKKFFHWFDGFKVIKYLNFVHESYYQKQSVDNAVCLLFKTLKNNNIRHFNTKEKLVYFRSLEKS